MNDVHADFGYTDLLGRRRVFGFVVHQALRYEARDQEASRGTGARRLCR